MIGAGSAALLDGELVSGIVTPGGHFTVRIGQRLEPVS